MKTISAIALFASLIAAPLVASADEHVDHTTTNAVTTEAEKATDGAVVSTTETSAEKTTDTKGEGEAAVGADVAK